MVILVIVVIMVTLVIMVITCHISKVFSRYNHSPESMSLIPLPIFLAKKQ